MPVALQIFATAAKDAGISTSGTTKELFKLMENGLIPAQKIMPFVSKGFSKFANKNDALNIAMTKLNKRYDVAKDSILDFNEVMFGAGVESGLSFLLSGFNDLMKSSRLFASVLGGVFKGAVVGITLPFRALYAVIFDITKLFGMHDAKKFDMDLVAIASTIAGIVLSATALHKTLKLIMAMRGLIAIAGAVAAGSTVVAGTALAGTALVAEKKGASFQEKMKEQFGGFGETLSKAALMLTPFGQSSLPNMTSVFSGNNYTKPPTMISSQQSPQKIELQVTLNDPLLEAKVQNTSSNMFNSYISGSW